MKRIELSKNIIAYQHEGKTSETLGYNSYVFLNGKEALVLDTTYPAYLKIIVDDLRKQGVSITKALPSHYHPDHIEGLRILKNPEIYGTKYSLERLNGFDYSEDEKKDVLPTTLLKDREKFQFGEHTFELVMTHGHSACSMFILINNKYLHVGDTYMTLNSGTHSLPYVTWSGVRDHLKALKKLYEYPKQTLLVSHGQLVSQLDEMDSGIKDRLIYLQALLDSNNRASVQDALKNAENEMINQAWRENVK